MTAREKLAESLFHCVYRGDAAAVQALLRKGVSPDACEPEGVRYGALLPPLTIAVGRRDYKIASILLRAGANPNLPSAPPHKAGITPLMIATGVNDPRCAALLLSYGASTTFVGDHGETAYSLAVRLKHKQILRLLAKHTR